ncbi:MAG: hypothetical protein J6V71_00625 [Clostridia bacterium]|nr:hypothetical protein [Clostridia bacterium]
MKKQFDKKQFEAKLTIKMLFWCVILLIGIISFILSTSLKGAAYNYDPKNYYGTYEGESSYGYIYLEINENCAKLYDSNESITYNYRYSSPTKVQEDYGKEDGCASIFLYQEDQNDGILFWLYNVDGEIYLREKISGTKLTCTS